MILICSENHSKTFLTPCIQGFQFYGTSLITLFMGSEELLLLKLIFIYFDTLKDTKSLIFTPKRYKEHHDIYSI